MRASELLKQGYKKGDKIYVVGSWNRKGTFWYSSCIIHSIGKKQMYLINEDDNTMARHKVYTDSDYDDMPLNPEERSYHNKDVAIEEICTHRAQVYIQAEIARHKHLLKVNSNDHNYCYGINIDLQNMKIAMPGVTKIKLTH